MNPNENIDQIEREDDTEGLDALVEQEGEDIPDEYGAEELDEEDGRPLDEQFGWTLMFG